MRVKGETQIELFVDGGLTQILRTNDLEDRRQFRVQIL
jgi:hypothetical protein